MIHLYSVCRWFLPLIAVVACGTPRNPPSPTGDTTAVSVLFAPVPTQATVSEQLLPIDSTTSQSQLDSLRQEIRGLNATTLLLGQAIARMDRTDSTANAGTLPTRAKAVAGVRDYGVRTIWAILVAVLAWGLVRAVSWFLAALAERSAKRRLFYMRFLPIVRLVTYSIAIYAIVAWVYAVDRNGLLAAGAAIGVGVGFASQGILKNLFGGLIIIFDQPFQVGDKIRIGGTYGEVVNIGLRATRIVTPDDSLVSVPNAEVVEGQVANANTGALDCQVVIDLYVPGWVDARKAKAVARSAAVMSQYVHLEKPVVVLVQDVFKEMFLTQLRVKAYVLDTRQEFIFASEVTETAKAEFLRLGMLLPGFPVRLVSPRADDQNDGEGDS